MPHDAPDASLPRLLSPRERLREIARLNATPIGRHARAVLDAASADDYTREDQLMVLQVAAWALLELPIVLARHVRLTVDDMTAWVIFLLEHPDPAYVMNALVKEDEWPQEHHVLMTDTAAELASLILTSLESFIEQQRAIEGLAPSEE